MQYSDWGERSARWSGIHSETVDLGGTSVHYLATGERTPSDAPVHLLVPNPAGSATNVIDLLPVLRKHGRVIAVDLPGSIAGHTGSPDRRATGIEPHARFLRDLTVVLGLDRVVVHGWSAGSMIAILFADIAPERAAGLVLAAPALPPPLSAGEARWWQTIGRTGLAVAPPVARAMLPVLGRRLIEKKFRALADSAAPGSKRDVGGGDMSRLSSEFMDLAREELTAARPKELGRGVTAMASILSAMCVRPQRVQDAICRTEAPTLLLWGDDDRVIVRAWIDDWMTRRPDWNLSVFEAVGHALPIEVPGRYADTVGEWMAGSSFRREGTPT
ncbi:alpha/beta hydrolase [Nocardia cyriacigeorgica]|uniref:Alpha/beta hydrolase n=1 Tax=Nocardia cyriacigeorgica TaxID=135487 RepID=A0A6P1D1B1_9NOCA|nr:alpha/beta hydrolase [Nocardia cyriacigeorgica]NEW43828.1 alpha/beta hydrolase [Nocardia cyriacigeorgica]NEW58715.1 alpha/beta hydrolase [Nocardia cyriacigeorgica]